MSRRPWTDGPWKINCYGLFNSTMFSGEEKILNNIEAHANAKLASKAPEMAEILIELANIRNKYIKIGAVAFSQLELKAKKLLKSVGWEGE
jgi:hypothetical protein